LTVGRGKSKKVIERVQEQPNKLVLALQNISEQVNEWQATLYLNFRDFTTAFDSIYRESLMDHLKKHGVLEKIVKMRKTFYEDFQCVVEDQQGLCDWFDFRTDVKQGSSMSIIVDPDSHEPGGRYLVIICYMGICHYEGYDFQADMV